MNDAISGINRAMQAQIDRLVAGELPEGERCSLLAWLDEDASRWRACALAFLEAQTWEAAATSLATASDLVFAPNESGDVPQIAGERLELATRRAPSSRRHVLAIAGGLLIAFLGGAMAAQFLPQLPQSPAMIDQAVRPKREAPAEPTGKPLLATVAVRTNLDPLTPAQLQVPVTSVSAAAPTATALSSYERQQWERRGFELSEELRYLPARLPDGREVVVPVNKVRVKFKGMPAS